jgi:serine/threonine protein kinase
MDYFHYGDLLAYSETVSLSPDDLLTLSDEIASGVEYLHMRHHCHLDLKPENILVTHDGHAKLTDFAFCSFSNGRDISLSCGTVGYAAPEVFSSLPFDGRKADIWSLGVLLYVLFARQLPFPDSQKISPAKISYKGIPDVVAELISSMLQLRPTSRPTISEIRSHRAFDRVVHRMPTLPVEDFNAPVNEVCSDTVMRLSECFDCDSQDLTASLASNGVTREKIVYHLLSVNDITREISLSKEERVFSLPEKRWLSAQWAVQDDSQHVSTVRGGRNAIVKAMVDFMIGLNYCVSGPPGGSKTLVLNEAAGDINLEIDVVDLERGSHVSVRGDVEKTGNIMERLNDHLLETFGVAA